MRKQRTRHNQSTYYTLMLVPLSGAGRTRSLRISRRVIRGAMALALCVVVALGVFSILAGYLGGALRDVSSELERTKTSYDELDAKGREEYAQPSTQNGQPGGMPGSEGESNAALTESERLKYDEQLEYYENKVNELTEQLQDLALTGEEMFELLSQNYPTIWPLVGEVITEFGEPSDPFGDTDSQTHTGIDIAVQEGTEVHTAGGGVVEFAGEREDYGILVIIDHGLGIRTYYAHNSELRVSEGETVTRGQLIALSGNTGRSSGAHLHYEVQVGGVAVNPRKYL